MVELHSLSPCKVPTRIQPPSCRLTPKLGLWTGKLGKNLQTYDPPTCALFCEAPRKLNVNTVCLGWAVAFTILFLNPWCLHEDKLECSVEFCRDSPAINHRQMRESLDVSRLLIQHTGNVFYCLFCWCSQLGLIFAHLNCSLALQTMQLKNIYIYYDMCNVYVDHYLCL